MTLFVYLLLSEHCILSKFILRFMNKNYLSYISEENKWVGECAVLLELYH